jgi:hypothetical protein
LAGFLLALATIKPQMVALLIPLVLIWAISNRRWGLIASFLGSLALLIATFSLFISDWIIQNLRQILSYPTYTLASTPGAILAQWVPGVNKQLGWAITGGIFIILIWEWRYALGKDFRWFFWTACLTITLTNMSGIQTATENYVAMSTGLMLVFATWEERWSRAGRWLVITSMVILFFGLWVLFLKTLQTGDQPIQHPIMFFPLPVFLLLILYWVRWWAISPQRLFLDSFRASHAREML